MKWQTTGVGMGKAVLLASGASGAEAGGQCSRAAKPAAGVVRKLIGHFDIPTNPM